MEDEQSITAKSSVTDIPAILAKKKDDIVTTKDLSPTLSDVKEDSAIETLSAWCPITTLRSHFNAVRSVKFHPTHNNALFSASEDHTAKLWNLDSLKKAYAV